MTNRPQFKMECYEGNLGLTHSRTVDPIQEDKVYRVGRDTTVVIPDNSCQVVVRHKDQVVDVQDFPKPGHTVTVLDAPKGNIVIFAPNAAVIRTANIPDPRSDQPQNNSHNKRLRSR